MYDGWGAGDFSVGADLWHPEVDFVIGPDFPDTGHYHGLEGVLRYTKLFLEPWDRITIEAEEMEVVEESIVAAVLQAGTGSVSGAATEFRYFQVWTFADGKVIHWQNYRDRESAMEAAAASS